MKLIFKDKEHRLFKGFFVLFVFSFFLSWVFQVNKESRLKENGSWNNAENMREQRKNEENEQETGVFKHMDW